MSTRRKKGIFQAPSAQARIDAFTSGGRAESARPSSPVSASLPVSTKRGRPAHVEETRRTIMALRKEDVQRVEELCLRWRRESDGLVSIKTTMVLRSLLAEAMTTLEQLERVEDETHLRELLRESFEPS